MSRTNWLIGSLVLVGLVALVVVPVYAHCGRCAADCTRMLGMMDASKMSLAKAVEMAEKESKGHAVAALCSLGKDNVEIEVYCLVGEKLMEVEVDAKTGKVSEMEEARMIPGEGHDAHDEDADDEEDEDDGDGEDDE